MFDPTAPAEPVYASDVPQPRVVVVTQPPVAPRAHVKFGELPVSIVCSNCQNTVTTQTEETFSILQWIVCGGLFCFIPCCQCGCCFIPLCMDTLKDIHHDCPSCHVRMGTRKGAS